MGRGATGGRCCKGTGRAPGGSRGAIPRRSHKRLIGRGKSYSGRNAAKPQEDHMTDVGTLDDSTLTKFSHVRPGDTGWNTGGLRDFFMYRDLGVAAATHGRVLAQLVRANLAPPSTGTGWHRH